MDKELKQIINEELAEFFKNGLPIGGEEKYSKQEPGGGPMSAVNIDEILKELSSIDEEKFRVYNDTLCPVLWDEHQKLDQQVRINLLKLAKDFYEKTGFQAPILDVYLMGSIANYNWTADSDADVHVMIDYNQLKMHPETTKEVVRTASSHWNDEHDVTVKGHKVELNIQNIAEKKPHVTGIYSLMRDAWIRQPVKQDVQINKMLIQAKYHAMKKYLEVVIRSGDREVMKQAKKYLDAFRQYGLDTQGELSTENIVFKILRAKGLLTMLKDAIVKVYDKQTSVAEVNQKDLRARLPQDPTYVSTTEIPWNKLTLDNLKALKDKVSRTWAYYKVKKNRENMTPQDTQYLRDELEFLNKINREIERRLVKINKPVAIDNPNEPFEEAVVNKKWLAPSDAFVSPSGKRGLSYLDIAHKKGEMCVWYWNRHGEFRKKCGKDGTKLSHDAFGDVEMDFCGRYDKDKNMVSIHCFNPYDFSDVPEELHRMLKHEFGETPRYMRFREGYGSGIPEKDRLKINNNDGTVKRWQVRSKNAPKTPKMNEDVDPSLHNIKPENPLHAWFKSISQGLEKGNRTDLFPEEDMPPHYKKVLAVADKVLLKKSNGGTKYFELEYVEDLLDDILSYEARGLSAGSDMYYAVRKILVMLLADDYDIRNKGQQLK